MLLLLLAACPLTKDAGEGWGAGTNAADLLADSWLDYRGRTCALTIRSTGTLPTRSTPLTKVIRGAVASAKMGFDLVGQKLHEGVDARGGGAARRLRRRRLGPRVGDLHGRRHASACPEA